MMLFRNNNASFKDLKATATATTIKVSGEVVFFKDGEWGVSYRAVGAPEWSYRATGKKLDNVVISGLKKGVTYEVCLYVKANYAIQRSEIITIKTA